MWTSRFPSSGKDTRLDPLAEDEALDKWAI